MTRPAPYTQAEIVRVIRALKAVGETVVGVERTAEGGFVVLTAKGSPQKALTPLEAWELRNGGRAA